MPAESRESAFRLNGSNGPTEEARCSLRNCGFFCLYLHNNSNGFLRFLVAEGFVPRSGWVSSTLPAPFKKPRVSAWISRKHTVRARTICLTGGERRPGRERREGRQGGHGASGTAGNPRKTGACGAFPRIPLPSSFWGNNYSSICCRPT